MNSSLIHQICGCRRVYSLVAYKLTTRYVASREGLNALLQVIKGMMGQHTP